MKYEEIELVIPTSWNDITIRMYQQFVNINKKKYSKLMMKPEIIKMTMK